MHWATIAASTPRIASVTVIPRGHGGPCGRQACQPVLADRHVCPTAEEDKRLSTTKTFQ